MFHYKINMDKTIEKISKLIEKGSKEEFEKAMFPTLDSMEDFKKMIEMLSSRIELLNKFPNTKKKFAIMKQFFQKLLDEELYDPKFDKLNEDQYKVTKKIGQGRDLFRNLAKKWESKEDPKMVDDLCKAYADQYERTCKLYLKPLAHKISKKQINSCGASIQTILDYDKNTGFVLNTFIPQIRNSVDHKDYLFNFKKNVIVFEDQDKTPLEITISELKNLIHFSMENEMCINAAENSLKQSLWKAVILESDKAEKLCKILKLDYDYLMYHFIKRGKSIFQLTWAMEQMIKNRK